MVIRLVMSIIFILCLSHVSLGNNYVHPLKRSINAKSDISYKLNLAQKYLNKNSNATFEEIIKFIQANPQWPQIEQIKVSAEYHIDNNTSSLAIVNWFSNNPTKTPVGYKFYASSAANVIKAHNKLLPIIRNGWIYGSFTISQQKMYYARFKKYLRIQDHVKKIDELIWRSDFKEAKRIMYLVDKQSKDALEASIALKTNSNLGEKLFKQISNKYYTSSLIFNYLQNHKHRPNISHISLFHKVLNDSHHAADFWKLQSYYTREFMYKKDYHTAYKIINLNIPRNHVDIIDAQFLSGWIALRFLKKTSLALKHFESCSNIASKPMSITRSAYWLGRTYEAKKDNIMASEYYQKASQYGYTFYGQLASIELKQNSIHLPSLPKISNTDVNFINNNEVVQAIKLLIKKGNMELAQIYAKSAIANATSAGQVYLITKIIKNTNNIHYTADIAKIAIQHKTFIPAYAFPTPYRLPKVPIESALVYSVIRQESLFNQRAASSAKAFGLMQLIKSTACSNAKQMGIGCNVQKLTTDPQYNIKLGSHYMSNLLKQYHGSYILAIATYDGGKAEKWVKNFGNPRLMKDYRQIIDWIELIPFYETRNYVQRVLENIQIYKSLLNHNNRLYLSSYLK